LDPKKYVRTYKLKYSTRSGYVPDEKKFGPFHKFPPLTPNGQPIWPADCRTKRLSGRASTSQAGTSTQPETEANPSTPVVPPPPVYPEPTNQTDNPINTIGSDYMGGTFEQAGRSFFNFSHNEFQNINRRLDHHDQQFQLLLTQQSTLFDQQSTLFTQQTEFCGQYFRDQQDNRQTWRGFMDQQMQIQQHLADLRALNYQGHFPAPDHQSAPAGPTDPSAPADPSGASAQPSFPSDRNTEFTFQDLLNSDADN
jgi:hypothetical protein